MYNLKFQDTEIDLKKVKKKLEFKNSERKVRSKSCFTLQFYDLSDSITNK